MALYYLKFIYLAIIGFTLFIIHSPPSSPSIPEILEQPYKSLRHSKHSVLKASSNPFPIINTTLSAPESTPRPLDNSTIPKYLTAIQDPLDTTFPRLSCPINDKTRYSALATPPHPEGHRKFFFTLNLHQNAALLPRLFGSILEAMKQLGPSNCVLSIVGGRSTDGTYQILTAMAPILAELDVIYFLGHSTINPLEDGQTQGQQRIQRLAVLRNLALAPLTEGEIVMQEDARIIFLNDASLCVEDILELVYQHEAQDASMTCAMDFGAHGTAFWDVYVARSLAGSSFVEISAQGEWAPSHQLFFDEPKGRARYEKRDPVQVYACWNGGVVLNAGLFVDDGVKFRAQESEDECRMGEPTYLGKDLWRLGGNKSRIMVVPSVSVWYDDIGAEEAKKEQGRVTDWVKVNKKPEIEQVKKLEWQEQPPGQVKCMPSFNEHSWVSPV